MPNSRWLRTLWLSTVASALPPTCLGGSAGAQPQDVAPPEPTLRMSWESEDPACGGDEVTVRALHLVTPGVVPRPLRARVEVRREGDQWLVRLQTESGELSGHRMLRADSCHEIQQAIALLLAMTMESKGDVMPPEPVVEAPAPPPPTAPQPPPSPPAPPELLDRPAPPEPREPTGGGLGVFVRLDGKAALGLMPGLGLGAGVTAGIRLGPIDVGVSGAFWPETSQQVSNRGSVNVARQSIGLRGCWNAWHPGAWRIAPCLAPELTYFRYVSEAVAETERGTDGPLPSVTGAVDIRYELVDDRLSLLVSPGLTWEQQQPFQIRLDSRPIGAAAPTSLDPTEIYKTTGIAPRFEVGMDARF